MAKHRTFNADKFLDKFEDSEDLIRDFAGMWEDHIDLNQSTLDVASFKEWLVGGEGDAKDELLEALYRVYDLCTDHGHEILIAAIDSDPEYEPDPEHALPVDLLALKVRTEREDLFNLAFDRYTLWRAERFTIYHGIEPRPIKNVKSASKEFQRKLADVFKDHKNSDRVLLRHYEEGHYVNFIVYHEKRVRSTLTFKGPKGRFKVAPEIYRPAQQDFISYNRETGQVEIEAGYENEETKLRRCFADCCLGDADFFEGPEAANRVSLQVFADPHFELITSDGVTASLVELRFTLTQKHGPGFVLRSKNVLETLELNGLRRKLDGDRIGKAVLKITFPDDQRGKRVELSGPNKIKFKRTTHAEDVFQLLTDLGILLCDAKDAAELRAASAAFVGVASPATAGDGAVSATRAATSRKRPRAK